MTTPAVHLDEFIEPEPLAITGNTLVFRMKKIQNAPVQQNSLARQHLSALLNHPTAIENFVTSKKLEVTAQDVFLPTSGVFAEAILGRANASEKVDATRFINWQDLPIPNSAPRIADLQLQNLRGEPLDTTATVPGSVLNIVNPPAFPDTTARDALNVLNNGNLFRDMSRSDVLAGVLNNLSSLANNQSQLAGNLAGQAQQQALNQAASIANKVADLTAQFAQSTPPPPATDTAKAAALNEILKLLGGAGVGQTAIPGGPGGAGTPTGGSAPGGGTPAGTVPGTGGTTPGGDSTPQPASQPAPNVLDETKRILGVSGPAATSAPVQPAQPVDNFRYTFHALFEDLAGNPLLADSLLINGQAGDASQTKLMGPPENISNLNVRDDTGALGTITPNFEGFLSLPEKGQGRMIFTAVLNGTVIMVGETALRLGAKENPLVLVRVVLSAQEVVVDADDPTEATRKVLDLAAPADGSASPLRLGAKASDVKDLFKVLPGAAAGKFKVLVPDGKLVVRQLAR